MTDPQPDLGYQLADALLGHILDRLAANNATPGKAYVWGGGKAIPSDDCCDGLIWTRVASRSPPPTAASILP